MSSTNHTSDTQIKPPIDVPPTKAKHTPWFNHYHRCALFFLIEAAFITFASFLLKNTIPLPSFSSRFSLITVKSAVGMAFLVWHTLAGACVTDIFSDAFSREWLTNPESPTDRVSTIKAGIVDRILYFPFSTATFKLTLCASLSLFILLRVGPSTVMPIASQFGALSIGGLILGTSFLSYETMTMEHVNSLKTGYEIQPNWIIPKPAYNTLQNGDIEYKTDVIHFNHSCQWHAPQLTYVSPWSTPVTIGGKQFDFNFFKAPPNGSQLAMTTFGTAFYPLFPLSFPPTDPSSAFLIFGGNSSFPLNSDPITRGVTPLNMLGAQASGNTIDLSGLPTVYNESWFSFSSGRFRALDGINPLVLRAPLATALLCDPQPQLMTGTVKLSSNNLTVQSSGSTCRVGNLNDSDIPHYFSYSLFGLNTPHPDAYINVPGEQGFSTPLLVDIGPLAAWLLFPQSRLIENMSFTPLPLDHIDRNMDTLVLTASKVQMVDAGWYNLNFSHFDILPGSGVTSVPATNLSSKQAFVSNPLWFGATTFTALLTLFLCLIISFCLAKYQYPPFDLHNICRSLVVRNEIVPSIPASYVMIEQYNIRTAAVE